MLINVTEHCNWMTPINFDHITCPVTTAVAAAAAATHQFVTHCIASNWAHAWIPKFVIHALTLCDKQRSVSRFETKKNWTTKNFVHISVSPFFTFFFLFFVVPNDCRCEQCDAGRYFVSLRSTVCFRDMNVHCAKSININVLFSNFPCGQQHFDVIFKLDLTSAASMVSIV